jgi:hypothetical protein
MDLVQRVRDELRAKGSSKSLCSPELSELLKTCVSNKMLRCDLDYATVGRLLGQDPSSLRKWLVGYRSRIRSSPGANQTVSLKNAAIFAAWILSSDESKPPKPKTGSRKKGSQTLQIEKSPVTEEQFLISGDRYADFADEINDSVISL